MQVALGEGDNSLGDRVPGLFAAQGITNIETYVNDKALAIVPPYSTNAQHAHAEDARDRDARGLWNWSEEETRRYFLAGGGTEESFAIHFARGLSARKKIVQGLDDRTYHGIIGGAFYLISGRKPL